jgi:hypothetical protein
LSYGRDRKSVDGSGGGGWPGLTGGLAGLVYILASVLGRNRPAFALGAWLVIAGASCAWQAPADILATCALAGGGGFLLIAVIETRLRAYDS